MTNTGTFGIGWAIGTCFLFFSSLVLTNGFEIYLGYIDVLYGQGGLGWASTALFSPSHHHPVFTITTHFFTSASVYATTVCFFTTTAHLSTTATPFNYHHPFGHQQRRTVARDVGCNSSSESGVLTGLQAQPFMIFGESWSSSCSG